MPPLKTREWWSTTYDVQSLRPPRRHSGRRIGRHARDAGHETLIALQNVAIPVRFVAAGAVHSEDGGDQACSGSARRSIPSDCGRVPNQCEAVCPALPMCASIPRSHATVQASPSTHFVSFAQSQCRVRRGSTDKGRARTIRGLVRSRGSKEVGPRVVHLHHLVSNEFFLTLPRRAGHHPRWRRRPQPQVFPCPGLEADAGSLRRIEGVTRHQHCKHEVWPDRRGRGGPQGQLTGCDPYPCRRGESYVKEILIASQPVSLRVRRDSLRSP
jgi:hypothetical protein